MWLVLYTVKQGREQFNILPPSISPFCPAENTFGFGSLESLFVSELKKKKTTKPNQQKTFWPVSWDLLASGYI